MAADAMATVGSPNYSGCFTCGSRDHEFRNCPKKSSNKAGKGGGIYMVSSMASSSMENIYAAPVEAYGQNVPGTMPSLIGHVQQPDLEGFAVLDTGATETITSLEALEFVLNKRRQRFGEERLQVVDRPPKVFRFGNGQTQTSESFVLIPQTLGKHHISISHLVPSQSMPQACQGAIVDCSRSVMVLKTVDAALMIPLKNHQQATC